MFAFLPFFALLGAQGDKKPADKPVTLAHVFKLNEKYQYSVNSKLNIESRQMGLETFIPEEVTIFYNFTEIVTQMKADGIAVLRYQRPQVTQVDGETAEHGPIPHVEKVNQDVLLTMTPLNEVVKMEDQTKKEPKKTGGNLRWRGATAVQLQGMMGQFVGEVYRLALFQGGLDSSLDLAPRLPLDEVSVGDTWKRTISYQPQKLKGKNQQAVQRLDYTYTYQGMGTWEGHPVYKVGGALDLNTDLADFFNQLAEAKPEETGLKSIPLQLHAVVTFYLDAKTMRTLAADGDSDGGFKVILTSAPGDPVEEAKMKGHTSLKLTGVSVASPPK